VGFGAGFGAVVDDEVEFDFVAEFPAHRKGAVNLGEGDALADFLEDAVVAGFDAEGEEVEADVFHDFEGVVVDVVDADAGGGDAEAMFAFPDEAAEGVNAGTVEGEVVVGEVEGGVAAVGPEFHFGEDVFGGALTPFFAEELLAKGAAVGAAAGAEDHAGGGGIGGQVEAGEGGEGDVVDVDELRGVLVDAAVAAVDEAGDGGVVFGLVEVLEQQGEGLFAFAGDEEVGGAVVEDVGAVGVDVGAAEDDGDAEAGDGGDDLVALAVMVGAEGEADEGGGELLDVGE